MKGTPMALNAANAPADASTRERSFSIEASAGAHKRRAAHVPREPLSPHQLQGGLQAAGASRRGWGA